MDTSYTMSRAVGLLVLGLLLVVIASGVYYYVAVMNRSSSNEIAKFRADYEAAEIPHHGGDVNKSIPLQRKLLADAPNPSLAAQASLVLANDLFLRNEFGDREEAYKLYKRVINNNNVSAKVRAIAMAEMASTALITGDFLLASSHIFNDEPYSQMLADAGGDVNGALVQLYERSDQLYPNAFAKLEIAHLYGLLLNSGKTPSGLSTEETAERMQQYVRGAELLFSGVNYEHGRLAQLYLIRATSLGISSRILKNVALVELEAAFEKAIEVAEERHAENSHKNVYSDSVANLARLFLALTINVRAGESRQADVKQLLDTFASRMNAASPTISDDQVLAYLNGIARRPDTDFAKIQIVSLADISPEFGALLARNGWNI